MVAIFEPINDIMPSQPPTIQWANALLIALDNFCFFRDGRRGGGGRGAIMNDEYISPVSDVRHIIDNQLPVQFHF